MAMAPSPTDSPLPDPPPLDPDPSAPASAHRLPFHPPIPEVATRFALLLRRLQVLHGGPPLQDLDSQTTLGLLDGVASSEADRHALRIFTPLVSHGFLGLLHHGPPQRAEIAQAIAQRLTVRPERLEQIASRIAPLASVKPGSALEALALFEARRRPDHPPPPRSRRNLWLGLIVVLGTSLAALALMAYGIHRGSLGRGPSPPKVSLPSPGSP